MKHKLVLKALVVFLFTSLQAVAQSSANTWQAQWISSHAPSSQNQWIVFRKTVQAKQIPQSLIAKIAVDSKYWLLINDEIVVREGGLKRGPAPRATYFDEVEIAPYLKPGVNAISVLVWHFGKHGFSHNNSGRAGLLFQAQANGLQILSDRTWKVKVHPAFSTAQGTPPNFRLPESSVRFDATQDITGWANASFNDSGWDPAQEAGLPPTAPWGALQKRSIPQWKDFGLKDYVNAKNLPRESQGGVIEAILPYNAQITAYMRITAPAGLLIDIRTDNFMGGSEANFHAEYVTTAGEQTFEMLGWINGHKVLYQIPKGVQIHELKYRETGYNSEFQGSFQSGDPELNTLWEKARRTLYITMRDGYMDCPDRERAQWWGDAVNEIGESFYVFDPKTGPMLAKKAIYELINWQKPNAVLYSPIPGAIPGSGSEKEGVWDKELPMQGLASVGWYGFWNYYLNTGDAQTMIDAYPAVKRYLNLWSQESSGLVKHRKGDWDWGDWGKNVDTPVLENAWYYLALKGAREMARLQNLSNEVQDFESKMQHLAKGFQSFWDGKSYTSRTTKVIDDRAQALAVVSGLADSSQYPAIREVLRKSMEASPYMEKYVLESLFMMNAADQGLQRMKTRYKDQIQSPLTTLWEGWGIGASGYGGGTYNHAWSGGPLTILSQYTAGLSPITPGWKTWKLAPQPGSLQNLQSVVPTVYGNISVKYASTNGRCQIAVEVPSQTTGQLDLRKLQNCDLKNAKLNGQAIDASQSTQLPAGKHQIEM